MIWSLAMELSVQVWQEQNKSNTIGSKRGEMTTMRKMMNSSMIPEKTMVQYMRYNRPPHRNL